MNWTHKQDFWKIRCWGGEAFVCMLGILPFPSFCMQLSALLLKHHVQVQTHSSTILVITSAAEAPSWGVGPRFSCQPINRWGRIWGRHSAAVTADFCFPEWLLPLPVKLLFSKETAAHKLQYENQFAAGFAGELQLQGKGCLGKLSSRITAA